MSFNPRYAIRTLSFNTSNLNDLASSLSQYFSVNGSTGIVVNSMNINSLRTNNITTTGANISNLSVNNITATNITGINLFLSSGSSPLTYYMEYTLTGYWFGPFGPATGTIQLNKIGNSVISTFTAVPTGISSADNYFTFSQPLPSQFIPKNNISSFGINVIDNSFQNGWVQIENGGNILIGNSTGGVFQFGHSCCPVFNTYSTVWTTN